MRKKSNNQHICSSCFTKESPQWRKGPLGSQTLCNKCGIKYNKYGKIKITNNCQATLRIHKRKQLTPKRSTY